MFWLRRLWRKAFFSDLNPLIAFGARQSLQAEDLPVLPPELEPTFAPFDETKINWRSGPALLKSLLRVSFRGWAFTMFFYLGNALLSLTGPLLVNGFVKRLEAGLGDSQAMTSALLYAVGIGGSGILAGLCIQHYFYHNLRRMQVLVNIINTKIFRHALVLSKTAREKIPVGDIVNHLSIDTDSVAEATGAFGDLVYCSVMISGAMGLLFYYLGSTAWVAVILLATLAPLTSKVSRDFTRFDEQLMQHRDTRVSLMAQILNAIRLVKYFVWEKSVGDEVARIRAHELTARRRIARAELMVTLLYVSVGTLVLFSVLAVHSLRGGSFDPALIFTCVSLFSLLEDPFAFISRVISVMINAKVGGNRIAQFLQQPTVLETAGEEALDPQPVGFVIKDLSVHLGESRHPALLEINLTLLPGKSLAIVGPVGSGKSTLIHALLGEVEKSAGEVSFLAMTGEQRKTCRIGYVPQESYILNGSLRENLSFGHPEVSEEQLQKALELAHLWPDVQSMAGGLGTEIGEKGINLSGGQRQRLSLARAILHRPQMVVLDDPLSAVDPHTEDILVQNLLFDEWRDLTKLVVTHRLSHLEKFDQIAFLEAGHLVGVGPFAELRESCVAFRHYLEEYSYSQTTTAAGPAAETATPVTTGEALRITEDEDRALGAVRSSVYWDYILSLGGENRRFRPWILISLFAAAASGTLFPLAQKIWLAYVSETLRTPSQTPASSWLRGIAGHPLHAIFVYGALGLLVLMGTLSADLFWLKRGLIAGRNIHDKMLQSILGASVRFFDSTPAGRILQRFSRDMEAIDIQLQWSFEHTMKCVAQILVTLTLIVSLLPWVLILIAPMMFIYYRIQKLYRASAREAKRLDSLSRSPRYAHFKETLQGLVVIRAYGKKQWFLEEFYKRLSHSQRMYYGNFMINRWFSSRIPLVGGLVALFTAFAIVLSVRAHTLAPATAGLLTVYSLSFWGVLNWGVRIWAEVEARMTSMERVKYYSQLPQESSVMTTAAKSDEVLMTWPSQGRVCFQDVCLRYAEHLPLVLKGLSFDVPAGSKVGIIGRTGSGKSTLFQALYRFTELESGSILIDGVDIASIPLARLRKALAVIPQDPTLFMGSIRSNLDRYEEFADAELWNVLDRTSLGVYVRSLPEGLQTFLSENGANLSQGQRQLMCLARALLLKAKVIILDEATASVDVKTDALVQRVVRESCAGVTMLIIAHRLGTVRDCDQILEISEGKLRRRLEPTKKESSEVLRV